MIDPRVDFINCIVCGRQQILGVAGFQVCIGCLESTPHCLSCTSRARATVYADGSLTVDVTHEYDCPNRAA